MACAGAIEAVYLLFDNGDVRYFCHVREEMAQALFEFQVVHVYFIGVLGDVIKPCPVKLMSDRASCLFNNCKEKSIFSTRPRVLRDQISQEILV